VILVIEHMKEIAIERVDVIQSGKLVSDGGQLFIEVLLGIPNFPHIELANAFDSITLVDNSWCLPLSAGQDYVNEVLTRRDNSDLLEIILHHLDDINLGYLFLYTDIKYQVKPVDKRKRSLDLNKTTRFQQHICQLRATKQNQTWNTVKTFHHERLRKNNCYLKWIDYNGSSRRLINPHNILLELFQAIRGIQHQLRDRSR
jgi:hypothetical protein